ncbi:MAG: hypothetical protein AAF429_10970 [Pseudomonadota bacterium]
MINASRVSTIILIVGLGSALAAAITLKDSSLLSLTPPDGTAPDALGREFWLHLSAYSAWVTTLLLIPALYFIWFTDKHTHWLAFWKTAWIAYIIHLVIAAFGFFGGDFAWMTNSTRVSAFWPGMVLAVWWGVDVALAGRTGTLIRIQRIGVHLLAFVLFFGGSALKGETLTIRLIGILLLLAVIGAGTQAFMKHRGRMI